MKHASWDDCRERFDARSISPDRAKARSLVETAEGRIVASRHLPRDESVANFVFEMRYASALEMLHALASLHGWKMDNHIRLAFFLRDALKRDDLFRVFDDCRLKQNMLVYYGKWMDRETADGAIERLDGLIGSANGLLSEKTVKGDIFYNKEDKD
jgi:hypothetical protein